MNELLLAECAGGGKVGLGLHLQSQLLKHGPVIGVRWRSHPGVHHPGIHQLGTIIRRSHPGFNLLRSMALLSQKMVLDGTPRQCLYSRGEWPGTRCEVPPVRLNERRDAGSLTDWPTGTHGLVNTPALVRITSWPSGQDLMASASFLGVHGLSLGAG